MVYMATLLGFFRPRFDVDESELIPQLIPTYQIVATLGLTNLIVITMCPGARPKSSQEKIPEKLNLN